MLALNQHGVNMSRFLAIGGAHLLFTPRGCGTVWCLRPEYSTTRDSGGNFMEGWTCGRDETRSQNGYNGGH